MQALFFLQYILHKRIYTHVSRHAYEHVLIKIRIHPSIYRGFDEYFFYNRREIFLPSGMYLGRIK